jgi:hypothetical protein
MTAVFNVEFLKKMWAFEDESPHWKFKIIRLTACFTSLNILSEIMNICIKSSNAKIKFSLFTKIAVFWAVMLCRLV